MATSSSTRTVRATFAASVVAVLGAAGVAPAAARPSDVAVTPLDATSWQQPSLAANPSDGRVLAMAYHSGSRFTSTKCGFASSSDGGSTWSQRVLVGADGSVPLPGGFALCFNPKVAYGADRTLYYAYQVAPSVKTYFTMNGSSYIFLMSSKDNGRTFGAPQALFATQVVPQGAGSRQDWDPSLWVDRSTDRLMLTWTQLTNSLALDRQTVYVASSDDHGATFSAPVQVNPPDHLTTQAMSISTGANGSVYASWLDITNHWAGCGTNDVVNTTCPGALYLSVSHDGGASFGPPLPIVKAFDLGCPGTAAIRAADPKDPGTCDPLHYDGYPLYLPILGGHQAREIYAAWWTKSPSGATRAYVARSQDEGQTWSTPFAVGATGPLANDDQHRPAIALAPNGRLDVVFYDRTHANQQTVWWSSSTNGGRSFSAPREISAAPSDALSGPLGIPFGHDISFGGFLSVSSSSHGLRSAWTDSRRGTQAHQDVFFGTAPTPSSGSVVPWIAGAGVLPVLVGVAVALFLGRRRHPPAGPPEAQVWSPLAPSGKS